MDGGDVHVRALDLGVLAEDSSTSKRSPPPEQASTERPPESARRLAAPDIEDIHNPDIINIESSFLAQDAVLPDGTASQVLATASVRDGRQILFSDQDQFHERKWQAQESARLGSSSWQQEGAPADHQRPSKQEAALA